MTFATHCSDTFYHQIDVNISKSSKLWFLLFFLNDLKNNEENNRRVLDTNQCPTEFSSHFNSGYKTNSSLLVSRDYVTVTDVTGTRIGGKLCGSQPANLSLNINWHQAKVVFHSDANTSGAGFTASYQASGYSPGKWQERPALAFFFACFVFVKLPISYQMGLSLWFPYNEVHFLCDHVSSFFVFLGT